MKNTPHINQTAEIAQTILLPGDPLRAKFIAENYLDDFKQFNSVRNILGYTGKYKGKYVSVMGTGMGMPSMGIYSYELINIFEVKNLIRIGSCGALQKDIKLFDIILAMCVSTDSNFSKQYNLPGTFSPCASWELLSKAEKTASCLKLNFHIGNVLSSDVFYSDDNIAKEKWAKMGILAAEMETAALYMTAARYGANALSILTVSDSIVTKEETTAQEREKSFTNMIEVALSIA